MSSLDAHEYRPALGTCGTAAAQVCRHRFADVRRQWKMFNTASFTAHDDLAGSPIDIVKTKLGDFARPQAETDQHGHDREVAAAVSSAAVARCQKPPDLVGVIQPLG